MTTPPEDRPEKKDQPRVQEDRSRYGDKPLGRLSGTGKPPSGQSGTAGPPETTTDKR